MDSVTKDSPLASLGLPDGDHWVRFHVEQDVISFEVAASVPPAVSARCGSLLQPTPAQAFADKWRGQGQLLSIGETAEDSRLAMLTGKHVR